MMLIFYFKRLNVFPENDLIINKVKAKLECIENCKINFYDLYKPFLSILSINCNGKIPIPIKFDL